MFRFVFIVFLLVLYLVVMIPFMLVLLIIRRFNNELSSKIGQKIVALVFKGMLFIAGTEVEIRGEKNIPEGDVLFISNHRSYFDILLAYAYTPKRLGFIAKAEMRRYILLKQWMDIVNCLFLDRDDLKQGLKIVLAAIEKVKSGVSVWVCPEGTRISGEDETAMAEFKEGTFKIAEKAKAPVVPVALSKTRNIFERQFPIVKKPNVIVEYLPPIYIEELDKETRKRVGEYSRSKIREKLLEINQEK